MSKNIIIKEDGTARSFSNVEKLQTNLIEGGTQNWVPEDEAAAYVDLGEKNITENGTYKAADDGHDGYSEVKVNVVPNLGTLSVTKNGTYEAEDEDYDGYSKVTVKVKDGGGGGGGGDAELITKTITENGTYDATDDGADGYSSVTVDVPMISFGRKINVTASGNLAAGDSIYLISAESGSFIKRDDIVFGNASDDGNLCSNNGHYAYYLRPSSNRYYIIQHDLINNTEKTMKFILSDNSEITPNVYRSGYLNKYWTVIGDNILCKDIDSGRSLFFNMSSGELIHADTWGTRCCNKFWVVVGEYGYCKDGSVAMKMKIPTGETQTISNSAYGGGVLIGIIDNIPIINVATYGSNYFFGLLNSSFSLSSGASLPDNAYIFSNGEIALVKIPNTTSGDYSGKWFQIPLADVVNGSFTTDSYDRYLIADPFAEIGNISRMGSHEMIPNRDASGNLSLLIVYNETTSQSERYYYRWDTHEVVKFPSTTSVYDTMVSLTNKWIVADGVVVEIQGGGTIARAASGKIHGTSPLGYVPSAISDGQTGEAMILFD